MSALEERLGHHFSDSTLLRRALTHPSIEKQYNNQRLEFVGDSVLGAVAAQMLYEAFPEEQEGELARRHAALVRGETLAELATTLGLGEAIIFSSSEAQGGGRTTASNLEDALEAIIGALFLDGGFEVAATFIRTLLEPRLHQMSAPPKDAKTSLQEWAQARGLPLPTYTLIERTGPAHAPEFTIEVAVEGQEPARAVAASKRVAEQLAAGELLRTLA